MNNDDNKNKLVINSRGAAEYWTSVEAGQGVACPQAEREQKKQDSD